MMMLLKQYKSESVSLSRYTHEAPSQTLQDIFKSDLSLCNSLASVISGRCLICCLTLPLSPNSALEVLTG